MFHKVRSAVPLPDYQILLHFSDGSAKQYDMKVAFQKTALFDDLKTTPGLFEQLSVDQGGYGISWNDDIDIDCEELWANGVDTVTSFDGLMSLSDASTIWGLHESTLRKALSYGKLIDGIDALKFGKQWVVTKDAMLREYGQPS